jgi:hypothetical protein
MSLNKTNFNRMTPDAKNLSIRTMRVSQIPLNRHKREILMAAIFMHFGRANAFAPGVLTGLGTMAAGVSVRVGEWWAKYYLAKQASEEAKTWLPYAIALATVYVFVTILQFISSSREYRNRREARTHAAQEASLAHQRHQELAELQFRRFEMMMGAVIAGRDPVIGQQIAAAAHPALEALEAAPSPRLLMSAANANIPKSPRSVRRLQSVA